MKNLNTTERTEKAIVKVLTLAGLVYDLKEGDDEKIGTIQKMILKIYEDELELIRMVDELESYGVKRDSNKRIEIASFVR